MGYAANLETGAPLVYVVLREDRLRRGATRD